MFLFLSERLRRSGYIRPLPRSMPQPEVEVDDEDLASCPKNGGTPSSLREGISILTARLKTMRDRFLSSRIWNGKRSSGRRKKLTKSGSSHRRRGLKRRTTGVGRYDDDEGPLVVVEDEAATPKNGNRRRDRKWQTTLFLEVEEERSLQQQQEQLLQDTQVFVDLGHGCCYSSAIFLVDDSHLLPTPMLQPHYHHQEDPGLVYKGGIYCH